MNTLSYTITRENLNCGNYNVCESAGNETASGFCELLMLVIFNILSAKEDVPNEAN